MSSHQSRNADDARARYTEQLSSIAEQSASLESKDRMLGRIRVLLFFLAIVFWVIGYGYDGIPGAGWIGWLSLAAFFVAATVNEPIRDRLEEQGRHRRVIQRLIARLDRDWEQLATKSLTRQLAAVELESHQCEMAGDLDLLGRASLFHLVSMAATSPGIRTLAQWLAGSAASTTAIERAAAVDQLAPLREQRLRFYTLARQVGESTGNPDEFVQWASGDCWLANRPWLRQWAILSAILTCTAVVAMLVAVMSILPVLVFKFSLLALVGLIVINLLITTMVLGPAHAIFSVAMANRRSVVDYQEIFGAADWVAAGGNAGKGTVNENRFLTRIRHTMLSGERSAVRGMTALRKVATAGALRQSAGTFLLYLPLQAFALWDVHVLGKLEDWQNKYRDDVANWFGALGEFESVVSIAALRDEYPNWATPVWVDADETITCTAVGHPLLADTARVTNDVEIGPPGTLLLVTGSNMSGKSTMLRSVGLNVALAAAGAPVCAENFSLPSCELTTSIRVSDNVSEGVSFYMAELKRLKSVVDQARRMAEIDNRVCMFLLDEILQGTNSRERQIAVVQVLRHLMDSRAIGAITTHDLELASEPELLSLATTVHFRETIRPDAEGNEQMTFDYKMRQGVSPTTNALRLLEMVGLGKQD